MREVLNGFHAACREARMEINPAKAAACILSLRRALLPAPLLRYDSQFISVDETITPLGITLDGRLTFSKHIEKTTAHRLRILGPIQRTYRNGL